jgi:pimeloyl-ACP methyl ester carboxylesterase
MSPISFREGQRLGSTMEPEKSTAIEDVAFMSGQFAQKFAPARRFDAGQGDLKLVQTSRADVAVRLSEGEGAPILLVHAVGRTSEDFHELFGYAVAWDHRLIAVDLPGHGLSGEASDHETAYTIEGFAETLLETLERLGVDSAFVIDLSLNGQIGKELMTIFPGMLGLAIVGGPSRGAVVDCSAESAPVYEIGAIDEEALEPIILSLELREAALSIAPRLWYGG